MADSQYDPLAIYTSKNWRTGDTVEPIGQGIIEGAAIPTVRAVEEAQWDEMRAAAPRESDGSSRI